MSKTNLSLTVNDQTMRNLGKILTEDMNAGRDAIHISVLPVVAGIEILYPNQDIGLNDALQATTNAKKLIGKVDPLLKGAIHPGQMFYMWLYPGTISSLHHHWTHPDIPNEFDATATTEKFSPESQSETERAYSEKWITEYALSECDGMSYLDLINAATAFLDHGDYLVQGGRFEGTYLREEFWDHFEVVTGRSVKSSARENFFFCAC